MKIICDKKFNCLILFVLFFGSVCLTGPVSANGLTINSAGKAGIGTESPEQSLHVNSGGANIGAQFESTDTGSVIMFYDQTNKWLAGEDTGHDFVIQDYTGGTIPFEIQDGAPTGAFRISSSGNVGIGTSSPGSALHIEKAISNYASGTRLVVQNPDVANWSNGDISTGIEFYKESTLNGYIRVVHTRAGGPHSYNDAGLVFGTAKSNNNAQDRVVIDHSGQIGIGTMFPEYPLDTPGPIRGSLFLTFSDERLKTEIEQIRNPLDGISKIKGVRYRLDNNAEKSDRAQSKKHLGLLAQDVEQYYPEAVYTDENGTKAIAYAQLIGPMIEAVKELNQQSIEQQKLLKTQQEELEALKQTLALLKNNQ